MPPAPAVRRSALAAGLVAVLTFGTGSLVGGWTQRLHGLGLGRYVVPILLANEAFGASRVYAAGSAFGWW